MDVGISDSGSPAAMAGFSGPVTGPRQTPHGRITACGAISLRRHCPDQVLGVAVEPPGNPASQPFRRDFLQEVRAVRLPLSPRRHLHHVQQGPHRLGT